MSLKSFLNAHREQLLRACEEELGAGWTLEQAGRSFSEALADLRPGNAAAPEPPAQDGALLGSHATTTRARLSIDQLARRSRTPLLLVGEFGTGKRHCVRALHAATYPEGELFELSGPEQLSELERRVTRLRTRTSSEATAGLTVYVHNLHEAAPDVQAQVASLLREQALQMRLIASSTCSLTQACREGNLRSDLVFGFPTIIELIPLRERASDIPELVQHFAALGAASKPPAFAESALNALQQYAWPGNVTELKNLVQRVRDEARATVVEAEHLPELSARANGVRFNLPASGVDLSELERELLIQALAMAQNNQSRAARLLGLTRDQIRYRLAKFDLLQQNAR